MSTARGTEKTIETGSSSHDVQASKEALKFSEEVSEVSDKLGSAAYTEVVDATGLNESNEVMGNVSEVLKEGVGENKGDSKGGKGGVHRKGVAVDSEQIRAMLLKNLPTEKTMQRQIEREIKKEIKYLHKKAIRMLHFSGGYNYFEMNNLMKKIRELKGILCALVKTSLENLKTLWLRFVHGVM